MLDPNLEAVDTDGTLMAQGPSGVADVLTVLDQDRVQSVPKLSWNHFAQCQCCLLESLCPHHTKSVGYTVNMGVSGNCSLLEAEYKYRASGLPPNSGQFHQVMFICRHLPCMIG
jgi:hypothetical protein